MPNIYKMSNAGGVKTLTRYPDMLAGNPTFVPSSYDSIATVTPYTTTSTIVFSSIPQTYTHLQIRGFASNTGSAVNTNLRFNSDSGSNYSGHYVSASGAAIVAGGTNSQTSIDGPIITSTASAYTAIVMDFLDYTNTNKNKTIRFLSGVDLNGSNTWLELKSGAWYNTAAITNIVITTPTGAFTSNSHWALYGIRG